jgi:predicted ATP-dependent protease
MSGNIHDKGMLILSGYLGGKYAQDVPLSLTASVAFEQSYSGIEGDSASVAEACALLSSISGIPIKQSLAVTGSINQHGEVQAIGGVTHKIEGFFDVCKAADEGLTGDQGVVIPQANVRNLMLKDAVVDAVDAGDFHIYPIRTVDDALTVLTGLQAGTKGDDGCYPEQSVNGRVLTRLRELAERLKAFGREGDKKDDAVTGSEEDAPRPAQDEADAEAPQVNGNESEEDAE